MTAPCKIAIVGQGCAGMATACHLLMGARKAQLRIHVDVFDAHPLGSGATGVAAGLLHPLAPSGKPLWYGMESYAKAAELVMKSSTAGEVDGEPFWRTCGLFRPATTDKQRRQFERNIGWDPRENLLGVRCTRGGPAGGGDDTRLGKCAGFYVPEGMVLDTKRYLEALWGLCISLSNESGCRISSHQEKVVRLDDLSGYDSAVVAAGAAVQEIVELRNLFELDLCQGYTVDIRRDGTSDIHEPSVLGQPYVAFQGHSRAIVGATQRHGATSSEAFDILSSGLKDTSVEATREARILVDKARRVVPDLATEPWYIHSVRSGVRAVPSRTNLGTIPYAGRIDEHRNCWVITGLGARGLVYHALLGELTSRAVLQGSDDVFAEFPELTRWRSRPIE
jgi:glycine/D-amino acid oxidase-like deaminating enzyme